MFPRLGGGHTGDKQPGTYLCPALKSHLRERVFKSKNGSLKKPKKQKQKSGRRGAGCKREFIAAVKGQDKVNCKYPAGPENKTYPVKELSRLHFLSAAAFLLPH